MHVRNAPRRPRGGSAPASATAITLTGPSSGTVSVASSNFTVGANGAVGTSIVVTPSSGGGGGTFTPTTVTLTTGSPTGTFTYTPASTGAKTISVTNNQGLTNPASITYTASEAAVDLPAWITATPGTWEQIASTVAPTWLGDFSGVAVRDDNTGVEVFAALGGGHAGNNSDNSVHTLQLTDAAPAWLQRRAASSTAGSDLASGAQAYYTSDGRPMPRHTYQSVHWLPERGSYAVGGRFWGSSGAGKYPYLDVFTPSGAAGDWTFPTPITGVPYAHVGEPVNLSARDPETGALFATLRSDAATLHKFVPGISGAGTWSTQALGGSVPLIGSGGNVFDTKRRKIFHLTANDWYVNYAAATLYAGLIDPASGARTAITFNSSAGYTAFTANWNEYELSALEHDPDADCFYFYAGTSKSLSGVAGRVIYKIIANASSVWDMVAIPVQGGTTPDPGDNGVMNKFRYLPRWNTSIVVQQGASVHYIRMPFASMLQLRNGSVTGTLPYTATVLPVRGEVPSGFTITSPDDTSLRASILSTHDDGSAAMVVVAGELAFGSANLTKSLAIRMGTQSDTPLTTSRIAALVTNITVNFSGTYGSASLTSFGSPDIIWWASSKVICARYRIAAPSPGSTTLEAVIDITAYGTGHNRALVECVIENGRFDSTNATSSTKPAAATYTAATVTINGGAALATVSTASVYSGITTHEPFRAWYCKGWIGTDPQVRATQRHQDLQRHPLFWKMDQDCTASLTTYGSDSYAPWGTGRHRATNMGGTGLDATIGPLTLWDAYALQSGDYQCWNAAEQNALAMLSYDINHRNTATQTVPCHGQMPTNAHAGTAWPYTKAYDSSYALFERAHHPAAGLMAFVARPSPVYIEIAQKIALWCATNQASSNILDLFPSATVGVTDPTGMNYASQVRAFSWGLRSTMHATFLSPDSSLNATYASKLAWRAGGKVWLGRSARYAYSFKLDGWQENLRLLWEDGPNQKTADGASNYDDGPAWAGLQIAMWAQHFAVGEVAKLASVNLLSGADKDTYLDPFADWYLEQPVRWVNDQANGGWRFVRDRFTIQKSGGTTPTSYSDVMTTDISGAGPSAIDGGWGYLTTVNRSTWTLTQAGGYESAARESYIANFWYALVMAVERGVPGAATAWATVTGEQPDMTRTTPKITTTNGGTALATWRIGFGAEPRWGALPRKRV